MAKELVWNVQSQGMMHQVKLAKNKIFIDGMDGMKLKTFPCQKVNGSFEYSITVAGEVFKLYMAQYTQPVLTYNGIDVVTNQPYVPVKPPKWVWVFYILFIIDFFLLVGGAVGVIVNGAGAAVMGAIASNKKLGTTAKVFICLGIWLVFTVLELIFAIMVGGLLGMIR